MVESWSRPWRRPWRTWRSWYHVLRLWSRPCQKKGVYGRVLASFAKKICLPSPSGCRVVLHYLCAFFRQRVPAHGCTSVRRPRRRLPSPRIHRMRRYLPALRVYILRYQKKCSRSCGVGCRFFGQSSRFSHRFRYKFSLISRIIFEMVNIFEYLHHIVKTS